MATAGWSVLFYTDADGRQPVADFLRSLDAKTAARFLWAIEQLQERNVSAGEPLVRHLGGKLWELRRESNTNIYRMVYAFLPGRRILFLHGFQKKTQKTPAGDIDIAQRRLTEFTERNEGR